MDKLVKVNQLRERILAMKDMQIWAIQEETKALHELTLMEAE